MLYPMTPKKILVRMPNWIGDAVMATPVLEDIKRFFPSACIGIFCSDSIACLLQGAPVDEVLAFSKEQMQTKEGREALLHEISLFSADVGLLLTNSFSSAWWFKNIPVRIGYKTHLRSLLLTHGVDLPQNIETQHLVLTYKQLLSQLAIPLSNTSPALWITDQEKKEAQELLRSYGVPRGAKVIAINPHAAFGQAKCWLPERFYELILRLVQEENSYILLLGDKSAQEMMEQRIDPYHERVISLAGKTSLRMLLALLDSSSLLVTNDSGPMHMAAARSVPLVAIFGSTNEIKTGPYSKEAQILHKHTACSPCYLRKCPIDFRCMKAISVDEVFRAVQEEEKRLGALLLQEGKLGTIIMAGGLATRLGSDAPKGCFVDLQGKSLFCRLVKRLASIKHAFGKTPKLAIMTSQETNEETQRHFQKGHFFGVEEGAISFFVQEELPLVDDQNRTLITKTGKVLTAPDGNGRIFDYFAKSGLLEAWEKAGIEYITVASIDNPLLDPFFLEFLGFHKRKGFDVSIGCIKRVDPQEKVGVVVEEDGKVCIKEYSEMDPKEFSAYNERGELCFPLANLSFFIFSIPFIKRIIGQPLPLHKAKKALSQKQKSLLEKDTEEKFVKSEYFIFDLLAFSQASGVFLMNREEQFYPLKNSSGPYGPEALRKKLMERDQKERGCL
jgi:heptosyltransferase-2